jgi:hypothetical protein
MNKKTRKKLREALHLCAQNGVWWEPDGNPVIPAGWVRELAVTGKIPGSDIEVNAKGVRVRGVAFDGPLDFEQAQLAVPLLLDAVEMNEPIVLEQATGGWISIANSSWAAVLPGPAASSCSTPSGVRFPRFAASEGRCREVALFGAPDVVGMGGIDEGAGGWGVLLIDASSLLFSRW